jgi:hypothetical protein
MFLACSHTFKKAYMVAFFYMSHICLLRMGFAIVVIEIPEIKK